MTNFEVLRSKIIKMNLVLSEVVESFAVFEALKKLSADNTVGLEEARANVSSMNRYLGFFGSTIDAHKTRMMLKLAHMFDKSTDSISLKKLLNTAESQIKFLNKDAFAAANAGRIHIDDLVADYTGIDHGLIAQLRAQIDSKQEIIDRLLLQRDKYLAHTEWNAAKNVITPDDMAELIETAESVIDSLSYELNHERINRQDIAKSAQADVANIIQKLRSK